MKTLKDIGMLLAVILTFPLWGLIGMIYCIVTGKSMRDCCDEAEAMCDEAQ